MSDPVEREVRIQYSEAPGYKKIGATGAYGGPTPTGHMLCHFFIDFSPIPLEVTATVDPDGRVVESASQESRSIINRELQVGVLLSPEVAKSIGEWLIKQSEQILQTRGAISRC